MKKWGLLDIFIGLLSMIVVFTIVILVFAISFPSVSKNLVDSLRTSLGVTVGYDFQDIVSNTADAVKDRASDGFEFRIEPFFINGYELVMSPFTADDKELSLEAKIEESKECLACHREKIIKRTALSHIYVDHKAHLEKGIYCRSCHPGVEQPKKGEEIKVSSLEDEFESEQGPITHGNYIKLTSVFRPASDAGIEDTSGQIVEVKVTNMTHSGKPATVGEALCVKCHKKDKEAPVNCQGCHPPGSVFADEIYAKSKADKFFGSGHIDLPLPAGFEHGRAKLCEECHSGKRYCKKCHNAKRMDHGPDWIATHGTRLGVKKPKDPNFFKTNERLNFNRCYMCHWGTWCSVTCHKNKGSVRGNAGLIVPLQKLEFYLNF